MSPRVKKKPGLTLHEHRMLGKELHKHFRYFDDVIETVAARYYQVVTIPERQLDRLRAASGALQKKLTAVVVKENHGALTHEELHAIYHHPLATWLCTILWDNGGEYLGTGFTLDQHRQVGLELAWRRDRLVRVSIEVANRYPRKARLDPPFDRLVAAIDDLRSWLDDRVSGDLPARELSAIYYPSQEARALGQARAS